jgi:hypothetical protein
METDFNYVLVSDADEGSSFSNTCNQELDFTTPYEVCLQDMLFSIGAWDNVREGSNMIYVDIDGRREIRFLTPGRYATKERLVEAINWLLELYHIAGVSHTFFSFRPAIPAKPKKMMRADAAGGYEINECTPHIVGDYTIDAVQAKPEFLEINFHYQGPKPTITFCGEIALLLGMVPTIYSAVPSIIPQEPIWRIETSKIDLDRNNLSILWVCADFIDRVGFGPTTLPLLRMVPIQADTGQLEHSMFTLQNYVPVPRRRIREFGITISERWDGAPVKIFGEVVLVLHFRARE